MSKAQEFLRKKKEAAAKKNQKNKKEELKKKNQEVSYNFSFGDVQVYYYLRFKPKHDIF